MLGRHFEWDGDAGDGWAGDLDFGVGEEGEEGMWRVERLAERACWGDRAVFEALGRAKSDKRDDVRGEEGA